MDRKGISPLIAAVLLIAFTMAVAGILTAWVTTFTQDTADQVGEDGEQTVSCSFGGLSIYEAVHDEDLVVSVANTGTVDFTNDGDTDYGIQVAAFMEDGNTEQVGIPTIESGSVETATFDDFEEGIDSVRATSTECPDVVAETSDIN